jgi:hypothetical protein
MISSMKVLRNLGILLGGNFIVYFPSANWCNNHPIALNLRHLFA